WPCASPRAWPTPSSTPIGPRCASACGRPHEGARPAVEASGSSLVLRLLRGAPMTGRLRQLHVIPYYDPAIDFGGVRTVCRWLAEEMVRRGHHVTILTTDVASRRARLKTLREQIHGVDVVRVRNLSQRLVGVSLYTPLGFARALGRLLPMHDVVHV